MSSMAISPIGYQNLNFRAAAKSDNIPAQNSNDYEVRTYVTEGSTGKKWGVGVASLFIPGLGQAINGQWGKGIGFFLAEIASEIMSAFALAKPAIGLSGIALCFGNHIWSIIDAVKNAKSEVQQVVPKGTAENNFSAVA